MDSKVPRRTLLKTLTSAVAVGATGCQTQTQPSPQPVTPAPKAAVVLPPPPRVNLICLGMLLFWQDKANPKNGITIYAPDTMGTHELRLSTVIGGLPNLLTSQAGTYHLQFGNSATSTFGPTDKAKNAVFYDDPSHPKGLAVNTAHTPFELTIPYPTSVRRHRVMTFPAGNPPYDPTGAAVMDFGVTPSEMAGVYVISWGNVDTDVTLQKGSGPKVTVAPMDTPLLNLLLYHCPKLAGSGNHLPHFNAMLKYTGHSMGLDLTVKNNMPMVVPKENEMVELDLSVMDTWDVQELGNKHGADPVGCLQGWGS